MAIQKIKRRKGIVYRVRLLIDGKRVTKCFDRKCDAMQFEQNVRLDHRSIDGLHLKFDQAATEWLENHARPRKAPGTVVHDEALLTKELIPIFGRFLMADITPRQVDEFIARLRTRMKPPTVNKRLELIRAIYNYHIRRRNVLNSPMTGVSFLKADPMLMKFWTLEEARTFLEHAKTKYEGTAYEYVYLLYLIALNTGMRLGEMLALKWLAVDFRAGFIVVCRTLCHATKQVRETTKGRRIRYIPINSALLEPLKSAWTRRGNSEWVLQNINGELLDENNFRKRHWKKDIKQSGVSQIRIHDMRHNYASHFLMNGGELFKLQAVLGHADVRTTMRYSHFSKAYLLDNVNIVNFAAEGNVITVPFGKTGTEG